MPPWVAQTVMTASTAAIFVAACTITCSARFVNVATVGGLCLEKIDPETSAGRQVE
jgi:hypothetical protein